MRKLKRKKLLNKTSRKKVSAKEVKIKIVSKKKQEFLTFSLLKKLVLKTSVILVIVFLNWTGISAIISTFAYLNDTESSIDNNFTAGTLDFYLEVPFDFPASAIEIGGFATKTIDLINLGNIPKYKVRADNFSGGLCNYLNLEANVDGDLPEYTGSLISFDFGPTTFTDPDTWNFILRLPSSTSQDLIGETCQFKFVFWGSQTRNDLPFGMGFNDTEEENNNVTAKICYDAETWSKGYWKNHDAVYKPYLPQYLGCNSTTSECVSGYEAVNTKAKVTQILETDYELSMRNKLRGQLLAMKFNIAHFKIGEYVPGTSIENLNQIVANADALLQQVPTPSDETLEIMKDFLEYFNTNLGQFRHCSTSIVKVIIPNGGEVWWVGRYYDLTWTTKNLVCPNDSIVSIWYSRDSGATWGNIATSTENDGIYNWRIPLYLEGGTYYVPSSHARIKVVTRCSENLLVNGWDMSDADFCPPIDYDLLTPEEIQQLKDLGLLPEEELIEGIEIPEITPEENSTTSEEISTTMEEITVEEIFGGGSGGTAVSTDEVIIVPEETPTEELPAEELIVEETPAEETPVPEETLIQEIPATEPEPVIVPDNSSSVQTGDGGSNNDGANTSNGETGGSSDAGASTDAGAPAADAGASVSE